MAGTGGAGTRKLERNQPVAVHEVGIVFLHHAKDPVTRHHHGLIARHNPGIPLLTVSGSTEQFATNPSLHQFGYLGRDLPWGNFAWWKVSKGGRREFAWGCQDIMLYGAIARSPVKCKRWCVFEWDARVTIHVEDAFRQQWNTDLAACDIYDAQQKPKWQWFHQIPALPEMLRQYAAGAVPLGAFMISDRFAQRIVAEVPAIAPWKVISELRIGTLCNYFGMNMAACPFMHRHVSWLEKHILVKRMPGIYHPVKRIIKD